MLRICIFVILAASLARSDYAYSQDATGYTVEPTGSPLSTGAGLTLGKRFSYTYLVDDFGAVGDGTSNDTSKIQDALNACHSNGGGKVLLGPKRYRLATTLNITGGCVLSAPNWPGFRQGQGVYTNLIYTLVLDSTATVANGTGNIVNQGLENIFLIARSLYLAGAPTDYRAALSRIAGFTGTGVTLVGGDDFLLNNVTMLGFGTCVAIQYNQRPVLDHVYGDCTNGVSVTEVPDTSKWRDVHFHSRLLAYGGSFPNEGRNVDIPFTGVTNIGGKYCLTGVTPSPLIPSFILGDTVYVKNAKGAVGVNGKFTIDPAASGCSGVLLRESVVAPTAVATVSVGNQWIKLNSTPSKWVYWIGQGVSDSGNTPSVIPSGAVIDDVWIGKNLIHINMIPTGTNTSDTLSISNPAYIPAGSGPPPDPPSTFSYSLGKRSGIAYNFVGTNPPPPGPPYPRKIEGLLCWNCFSYGFDTAIHIGTSVSGLNFTGGGADNDGSLNDPTTIGLLIDDNAAAIQINGAAFNSYGRDVVVNNATSGNNSPNLFLGGQYATTFIPGGVTGASFELNSMWYNQIIGLVVAGDVKIADNVLSVQYSNIFGPGARAVFEGTLGFSKTRQDGSSFFAATSPAVGSPVFKTLIADSLTVGTATAANVATSSVSATGTLTLNGSFVNAPGGYIGNGGGALQLATCSGLACDVNFVFGGGGVGFQVRSPSGAIANSGSFTPATAGNQPEWRVAGSDANVGLRFTTQGNLGIGVNTTPSSSVRFAVSGAISATTFIRTTATTVGNLSTIDPPGSAAIGDRAMVTDASTCSFGASVVGGGSVKCPVFYNGTSWIAG